MKLAEILQDLVERAGENRMQPQYEKLPRGLTVGFVIANNAILHRLSIFRRDVFPSDREWITVQEHFPYPLAIAPLRKEHDGLHALTASWMTEKCDQCGQYRQVVQDFDHLLVSACACGDPARVQQAPV